MSRYHSALCGYTYGGPNLTLSMPYHYMNEMHDQLCQLYGMVEQLFRISRDIDGKHCWIKTTDNEEEDVITMVHHGLFLNSKHGIQT